MKSKKKLIEENTFFLENIESHFEVTLKNSFYLCDRIEELDKESTRQTIEIEKQNRLNKGLLNILEKLLVSNLVSDIPDLKDDKERVLNVMYKLGIYDEEATNSMYTNPRIKPKRNQEINNLSPSYVLSDEDVIRLGDEWENTNG